MAVTASEEVSWNAVVRRSGQQDTVAVFLEESMPNPLSESQLGFQSLLVLPNIMKNHACLGSQSNSKHFTQGKMCSQDGYAHSILDVDIGNGEIESPKSIDEAVGSLKTENYLIRAAQREISFQIGGKFMQLLMNQSLDLPKFASRDKSAGERVYDTPTHRSRKYKRSASFNSRRVVLLFSVLSILGTMILIYLTLRDSSSSS